MPKRKFVSYSSGMFRLIFWLILFAVNFTNVQAQIVNIESSRIQTDTLGWAGSGGASVSFTKNTQQVICIDLQAHLQHKSEKNLWLILADYGFLKGGQEKYLQNSFGHLRFNHKVNKILRWEAFAQVQSNHIMQIKSRVLTGTGPRFKLFSSDKFRLYAATLMMYEYEVEKTKEELSHHNLRSSSYISFTYLPADNIELVSTVFYQPQVGHMYDFRVFNQTSFEVQATDRFSMHVKLNWLYDNRPAGTAPGTNFKLVSGFSIDF